MKTFSMILATGTGLVAALAAAGVATSASAAGPDGAQLFKQRCQLCHAVAAGKPATLGPNLAGVVGRKAASTGFNYSPALKASNLVWTKPNLDAYLTAPAKKVPGTRMAVAISDPAQRAALIQYLSQTKR